MRQKTYSRGEPCVRHPLRYWNTREQMQRRIVMRLHSPRHFESCLQKVFLFPHTKPRSYKELQNKRQIPDKFHYSVIQILLFGIWSIGIYLGFGVCCLIFWLLFWHSIFHVHYSLFHRIFIALCDAFSSWEKYFCWKWKKNFHKIRYIFIIADSIIRIMYP